MLEILKSLAGFLGNNAGELVSALSGAFFGAIAAYWFQRYLEKSKLMDANHAGIMRAQLALISQMNTVENYRRQHLDPLRADPQRDTKLLLTYRTSRCLEVNYEELAFLLESDNANTLMRVQVAERSYWAAIEAIDERNDTMRRLHDRAEVEKADLSTGYFTIRADPRDIKLLKDNTGALYGCVDHAEKLLSDTIVELKRVGKALFPKRKFLSVEGTQTNSTKKNEP